MSSGGTRVSLAGLREAMREPVQRRVAAILAADVAGYSRLMGADKEGTLAALKAIRRRSSSIAAGG